MNGSSHRIVRRTEAMNRALTRIAHEIIERNKGIDEVYFSWH